MFGDLPQIPMFRRLALVEQWIARSAFEKALVNDPAKGLDLRAAEVVLQSCGLMDRGGLRQRHQENPGELWIAEPFEQPQDLLGLGERAWRFSSRW